MTGALLYGYLGGWILTSIGIVIAVRRLQDRQEPAAHPTLLSIAAGAVWPVLVVALAEASLFAFTREMTYEDEPQLSLVA